jgi:hypothetical protein
LINLRCCREPKRSMRCSPEKKDGEAGSQAGAARVYCCPLAHGASCTRNAWVANVEILINEEIVC